jgi:hypothetical protein
MYKEFETKTSYNYLKDAINHLKEPICILGGWAVFFHVNKKFHEAQGRPYLGSRDIDLGFHIKESSSDEELKNSTLNQTISILIEKLGFKPLSFRLFKEIHTETEEEINKGEVVPTHFIFPLYIDLIVDCIPRNFRKILNFDPIDEPLLKFVFENNNHTEIKEFGKNLLLPIPELLLAMKISSLPNRDKEHKKVKDICDIFALLWYSNIKPTDVKKEISKYISDKNIKQCLANITKEDLQKAGTQIGHTLEEIEGVIDMLK